MTSTKMSRLSVLIAILFIILNCNFSRPVEPLAATEDVSHQRGLEPVVPESDLPGLGEVTHWLYLIDVNLDEDTVEAITHSSYQMVVIDFITSEADNADYPLAATIAAWHGAPQPKRVLAYIDIGQAEAYRTYWEPDWHIGNPEWIVGADPDGWAENYPVAYWYDAWQGIWLAEDGYLDAILAAGFDGVYLDWVEAYSDVNVQAVAEAEGLDAEEEMVWFVADIGAFGRAHRPDFWVVAQNAAELARNPDYREAINAIAQEQIWFDGGADNDPPGDCPLPRLEADVDTDRYRESLMPACRRQYDAFPESTLHVSSEAYLADLTAAQAHGLVIFTVDYALDPDNIAWVYAEARRHGFVPFVGNRALDRFVPVVP